MNSLKHEEISEVNNEQATTMYYIKKRIIDKFPALAYDNYRYFLFGQCISLMGTWVQKTAQQWVIYQLTKSPIILGLVGVFQFTPMLLFSLFAGVLVDRFPKKKFLIVTQTIQMIQAFALAILLWSGHVKYWHILILAGFLGLANTFDMPTRQSFFIELVGKEALISAIGLNSTVANIGRIIGPAFAAMILLKFGSEVCFLANGLSFIAVIIGLIKIKTYDVNIRLKKNNILSDIKDGVKYVFSSKVLANAVISMLIVGTIVMNSDVIIPVFVKEVLHQQESGYSFMLTAMGIGSLIGSVSFTTRKNGAITNKYIFKCGIILSTFLIGTGLLQNYYLSLFSVAGIGGFSMIFMASINSTIQLNSDHEYRGRAMSIYSLVLIGTTPIGNFLTGVVTEKLGANMCFLINGALTAVLLFALFMFTSMKNKN